MSFNLNNFISRCKQIIPKYFKVLEAHDLPASELNNRKRLIVTFLKEYVSYNNNKFYRSHFNLEFFPKFFCDILPNQNPELLNDSFDELQSKFKDFFNYLSLHKVVEKDLTQKIFRCLDKEPDLIQTHHKPLTSINFVEEDFDEYSEEILDDILEECDMWCEEFINTKLFENLTQEEKGHVNFIIEYFFHYLYDYLLIYPEHVNENSLEEICLDIFPRKISAEESFFKAVVPVLSNFFVFLNYKGIIHNAGVLCKKLSEIQRDIIELSKDPRNWGMPKSMFMGALEAGVDVEDTEALNSYFNFRNLQNLLKIDYNKGKFQVNALDYWSKKDIEALETKEIIQKLIDLGISFEEVKFREEIQKVYSVSEFFKKWKDHLHLNIDGKDEDFIWWAIYVLWKRLAPEIMNMERIDDMMQEGYDLIDEDRYIEGCLLWLQVWEHLKKKFQPEMTSIEDAEKTFQGSQSLYNWCGDFSEELYRAGKKDPAFFKKRLTFCKEFIEFFPETEDYYLACIKRDLADTCFLLDLDEEGEKLFQELVKNQPDFIFGYIAWGDQYSGLWNDTRRYNHEKAMSLYKLGLKKAKALHNKRMKDRLNESEIVLERINDLEERNIGVHFKENLLDKYKVYLSHLNLSTKTVKKKMQYGEKFLDYLIFIKGLNHFNTLTKALNSEIILDFLGYWTIHRIVTSKTALIDVIKATESYIYYLFENFSLNDKEMESIKPIFASTDFFIERFTSYQKNVLDPSKKSKNIQNFQTWINNNKNWNEWIKKISRNY